jgi:hypothetical protein
MWTHKNKGLAPRRSGTKTKAWHHDDRYDDRHHDDLKNEGLAPRQSTVTF